LNQKNRLAVVVVVVAIFAVAIAPMTTSFAQEDTGNNIEIDSEDKTHEGKAGKSCPGKNKEMDA
jgi:hypothetical protein